MALRCATFWQGIAVSIGDDEHETLLAGDEIPKQTFLIERVERAPEGKADYKWRGRRSSRAPQKGERGR